MFRCVRRFFEGMLERCEYGGVLLGRLTPIYPIIVSEML